MSKTLLIFSYDYPPSDGGIARLCQEIADGMSRHYTNVRVLTIKKEGLSKTYNFEKVAITLLPKKRFIIEIMALWYLLTLPNKKTTDVICSLWHPEGLLCYLAGIKNYYILGHGTEYLPGVSKFRKYIWIRFVAKLILNNSKQNIANSKYTAGLMRDVAPQSAVTALPLGVNHNFFAPTDTKLNNGKLNLVTVSRILKFKGYDFIAQTIHNLPQNYKDRIEWNIGGTGTYLNELKLLVQGLGLNNIVKFHGFVPDDKLPAFYSENDVFIMCTRESENDTSVEGFGLVFLEAQSSGIPAIGTLTGGIPDAIKHLNGGWLIPQDDSLELTRILKDLIDNPQLIRVQSVKARTRVITDCTWTKYCENLDLIIKK